MQHKAQLFVNLLQIFQSNYFTQLLLATKRDDLLIKQSFTRYRTKAASFSGKYHGYREMVR